MWVENGSIDQDFIHVFSGKDKVERGFSLSFRRYISNIAKPNGAQRMIVNLYFYFIFLNQSLTTLS
jgi:hypothetical protein